MLRNRERESGWQKRLCNYIGWLWSSQSGLPDLTTCWHAEAVWSRLIRRAGTATAETDTSHIHTHQMGSRKAHEHKGYCQVHPPTNAHGHRAPEAPVRLFWHCENNLGCSLYLHQSNQRQPSGSISQRTEALRLESSSKSEDTCEDSLALLQKFVCHWARRPWHQAFGWDALIQTLKDTNKQVEKCLAPMTHPVEMMYTRSCKVRHRNAFWVQNTLKHLHIHTNVYVHHTHAWWVLHSEQLMHKD